MHEEDDDISEKFEVKYDKRYDKIGGIYLIKVQVQMIVDDKIED